MQVLLLGGAGYIGRVVANRLKDEMHGIKIIDLFNFANPADVALIASIKIADTRSLKERDFENIDVVLDLAALSNDPAGELNPLVTRENNASARIRAAALAKAAGVQRYVLFSSCSVYGASEDLVDERSRLNPLTEYAAANVEAEGGVLGVGDAAFTVTVFRLATVFGLSPSMRFDLVVNTMVASAFENGRIVVSGDGRQYRPLVHVGDVAKAVAQLLGTPAAAVHGEIFNISLANFPITDVAKHVLKGIDRPVELVVDDSAIDHRNYRVTNDKAERQFGYRASTTITEGAKTIFEALKNGVVVRSPSSIRLDGYRTMVASIAM
jgi:nucleoside-diphosphate-sugar epimerase